VYYLAAFHHASEDSLGDDGEMIRRSFEVNTLALANFLNAIAIESPESRIFYAASSRVFGAISTDRQDEATPFSPTEPYGISKTAGIHLCRYYRSSRNVFAIVRILFNHESPRRPSRFVSRKIARAAVRISRRKQDRLVLGNLDTAIDWGYAPDYVDAMWRILQLPKADDFVISTGESHSIVDFVKIAFGALGLDWKSYVDVRPDIARKRSERPFLGNSLKLKKQTGWRPTTTFHDMVLEIGYCGGSK
jgi:GDPmannose 4,6-dehydratase